MQTEMATSSPKDALRAMLEIFLEIVQSAGEAGSPAGPMYAAVMGVMRLEQFEAVMSALVKLGCLRKSGHVYYFVKGL